MAGPVSVGVVAVPEGFDVLKEFPGVADSKKLSEKKREKIFEMLTTRASAGDVCFAVEFESAETIDREGIAVAVRRALARGVNTLAPDAALVKIQLDGASAPLETSHSAVSFRLFKAATCNGVWPDSSFMFTDVGVAAIIASSLALSPAWDASCTSEAITGYAGRSADNKTATNSTGLNISPLPRHPG